MTFQDLQYQFAAHLRDPARFPAPIGIEDRRLGIYRHLFFNNIEGLIGNCYPVIKTILGSSEWHQLIRDFYRDHQSHTPLFTELGREFLNYLEHRAELPRPFLIELAHYEWSEAALFIDDAVLENEIKFKLFSQVENRWQDHCALVSPQAWVFSYRYPVQHIRPEFQPSHPSDEPIFLILVRDLNDDVRFIETNALTAQLVDYFKHHPQIKLGPALQDFASTYQIEAKILLQYAPELIQDLLNRHVLLGFH